MAIFPLTPFISGLLCAKFHGEGGWFLTILYILKVARAMLINFCVVNTPRCQILILGAKYFACLNQFSPVKR